MDGGLGVVPRLPHASADAGAGGGDRARARAQTRETKVFITAARALQEPFHLEGPDLGCVVRSA